MLVHNRDPNKLDGMPSEGCKDGSWNGTRDGEDGDSGMFRITNATEKGRKICEAAARPGEKIPSSVVVEYTDRQPDFCELGWSIDGVEGTVRITMDTDENVTRTARHKRDMAAADLEMAQKLRDAEKIHPKTGNPWTPENIKQFRSDNGLNYHHEAGYDQDNFGCDMLLMKIKINDAFYHTGSRSKCDVQLGLDQGGR
jgi:hypothetical protein